MFLWITLLLLLVCSWVWSCCDFRYYPEPRKHRGFRPVDTRTALLHYDCMLMHDRDRLIVLFVGRFGQATAGHARAIFFHDLKSATPTHRALARLTERKYLARIERRMIGGNGAGSGHYVYQLGSKGWALCKKEGRYWPFRSVNYHSLAIADAYVQLKAEERTGSLQVIGALTEPDTHRVIAGAVIRPDMELLIGLPARHISLSLWVEIDLGTERPSQIKDKLSRYWHAYQNATEGHLETFPVVLFLAPDQERVDELKWLIQREDEEAQSLFMVGLISEFPQFLLS